MQTAGAVWDEKSTTVSEGQAPPSEPCTAYTARWGANHFRYPCMGSIYIKIKKIIVGWVNPMKKNDYIPSSSKKILEAQKIGDVVYKKVLRLCITLAKTQSFYGTRREQGNAADI